MWPDAYFEGLRSSPVGTFCPSICCPFQKLHALMITRICCRENSWNVNGTDRRIRIFLNILSKKTFSKTRSLWVGFACVSIYLICCSGSYFMARSLIPLHSVITSWYGGDGIRSDLYCARIHLIVSVDPRVCRFSFFLSPEVDET